MSEQAVGVPAFIVAPCGKMGFQCLIGNASHLGQTVHGAADLNVKKAFGISFCCKVVVVNDVLWDEANVDVGILIPTHGGAEIKVLDVKAHEVGVGGGDNIVKE